MDKSIGTGKSLCGIDEAGRGPTAGPVCASATILDPSFDRSILRDSKQLSPGRREKIASELRRSESLIGIGWAWPEEIDRLNIHNASLLAMRRAFLDLLEAFSKKTEAEELETFLKKLTVLVDGSFVPDLTVEASFSVAAEALVHGDSLIPEISAASIIAKVSRDRWMLRYSWIEPRWEFHRHKGYPTARHRELCRLYGLSPIHRRSFHVY
jgi:ribonuclease HII